MRPLSLPSNSSILDPENSLVLYQVKQGDSVSKILNRITGQTLKGKTLDSAFQMTKNLNPKLRDINQITPGQWLCLMHPLYHRNSLFHVTDLNNLHSIWENIDEKEKSFLSQNWDTIDLLADIASRTDNVTLTALPAMAPSLTSAAIQASTGFEEKIMVSVRQVQRLIIERRKNASRFIFQHFNEIKMERLVVISFKPGRIYSLAQKLESLLAMTNRLKLGPLFLGLDIAIGGAEVAKTYMESNDVDKTQIKATEVAGKIIISATLASIVGAKFCGIAILNGATFGPPGIIAGSTICVGAVITGAVGGEKLGKAVGSFTGKIINDSYHWITSIYPLIRGRLSE